MKALYVLIAAAMVLFLLGRIRVGGRAEYSVRGFEAWLRLGVFRLRVFPLRRVKADKPPKKKVPRKKPPTPEGEPVSARQTIGGVLEYARALLPIGLEAAGQFSHKLRMDNLFLELTVGASDPADAALRYGQANGVLGAFWYPLTQAFHVKNGKALVRVDFDASETTVYGSASLSLKIGQIFWLGLYFGWKTLLAFLLVRKRQKSKQQQRKAA
ncbi:MAG: DUF2953 domain-containing protein [Lawsonibacter sp.]|nr:DUF2953 domain-containing protein [Lawsonibacter sp.]